LVSSFFGATLILISVTWRSARFNTTKQKFNWGKTSSDDII